MMGDISWLRTDRRMDRLARAAQEHIGGDEDVYGGPLNVQHMVRQPVQMGAFGVLLEWYLDDNERGFVDGCEAVFTERDEAVFTEHFGELLIELGYETDDNW